MKTIINPSLTLLSMVFSSVALWALWGLPAYAAEKTRAETLSLDAYLSQVRQNHGGLKGLQAGSSGAELRSKEAQLLVAPTVFSTIQYTRDGKPPAIPLYTYDFQNTANATLGVSQTTTFGLQAKLYYNLLSVDLVNPASPLFTALAGSTGSGGTSGFGSYNTTTTLELSQSLWANGFGGGTRAAQEQAEAQALATSFLHRFAARVTLTEAETAYWNLVTARQAVNLTEDNLQRAQKNFEWADRRARLQLADKSDALQAEAALHLRKLELQSSKDAERTASQAFNSARGSDLDAVAEALPELTSETVLKMEAPRRAELRDDVKAAAQQERLALATAKAALEHDAPTLDIFGSIALNGRDTALGSAVGQSFSVSHPTETIGLRFSAPINFGVLADTREGYRREQTAAELNYQRKLFDQEQTWKDLGNRFTETKRRLQLAASIESVQQAKFFNERSRLQNGRSTSFQVLSFETDYTTAQLNRLRAQSEVIGILAQMKLFGEDL